MHLLATTSGVIDNAAEAVDLKQSPGDIVILSAADSELSLLAQASDALEMPSLRLANILQLQHPLSIDLYIDKTLRHAKLIVLRLLGGRSYWSYGLDQISAMAQERGITLAVLPGDMKPDPELEACGTADAITSLKLHQYLAAGGPENARNFLLHCAHLLGKGQSPPPPAPLARASLYRRSKGNGKGEAAIVFYRSLLDGGLTAPIDGLIEALRQRGIGATAFAVTSLKDAESAALIAQELGNTQPDAILNATSFAVATGDGADPLAAFDCPVLQVVLASSSEESWADGTQGLNARDLAMNVVLPELDGRILSRAISFKADAIWHQKTECRILTYRSVRDRVDFVAELAANWAKLRRKPASRRKIAIVLANYPNKDGRIANGVGYDTPASTIAILDALRSNDYDVRAYPATGNALIEALQAGTTNARRSSTSGPSLSLAEYQRLLSFLPPTIRERITSQWGAPKKDPFFEDGHFHLPVQVFGNVAVAIQPARGYNIDPKSTYHDPALVPPHGYLAFYLWLRHKFEADTVIHNGKHGNLEWQPGKALALSSECLPEAVLGPLPQLYPFIVNDPGEGTQAKRRTSAVIIDHLTPPLTRAETYGPLKDLEALIDEYYLASGLDRRRLEALRQQILDLTRSTSLDRDAGFTGDADADLRKLDAYICDLKEAQIRDGLHVLGRSPEGALETDLLVALARVPRGIGEGGDASLIRALAIDFGFADFDPLACDMASPWSGIRPKQLAELTESPWRTAGDTVERLELFALMLKHAGERSAAVIAEIESSIRPRLRESGAREIANLLKGLDGRNVEPGASGAPTRGRLDVLPTGRNFFSIDSRTVPTPIAWRLGQKSAEDMLARHFQDHGCYPKAMGLSAWGTSNMRTGGDDIAQALALIGVKPVWESASWRVTGFEIIPLAALGRPRVDLTLRISGFFRDAFPSQIELLDKAIRAVGTLDEDAEDNPLAERMKAETHSLMNAGVAESEARDMAGHRIFGSKPGAYGAGLQALIDERLWSNRADLAAAYVTWGAYAYGTRSHGISDTARFSERLKRIEAVIHNQDNREHDLLDSDDYYQFEGGMAVAVAEASGRSPTVYHNDHSRPERPVIRTLEEEVGRVMRSRVVNPKWISGVKRHGYKGAFEIAATIDYMFAFAATTGAVKSHHFDLAYDAFLADAENRGFIAENNPAALREIAQRFEEAAERGLWQPRVNSVYDMLKELAR